MRYADGQLILGATDLSSHFECGHKTTLDLRVARKELQRPGQSEIERQILEQRGHEHEARVLAYFHVQGLEVCDVAAVSADTGGAATAAAKTLEAMQRGVAVIYQGTLVHGVWVGRPDFLLRVGTAVSRQGGYLYEPVDAKLARDEKARAILQLCTYADLLAQIQGVVPEHIWLASGGTSVAPVAHRTADYLAYYRQAQRHLTQFVADPVALEPYPEPVEFCGVCQWWARCEQRRRQDDHLSLVAGITSRQRTRLEKCGVSQLTVLGQLSASQPIEGIESQSLKRLRDQARLQLTGRETGTPQVELILDGDPKTGLELLPEPTPGDLFVDLEGDAFALNGGLEYLFGVLELGQPEFDFVPREKPGKPRYQAFWGTTRAEEKLAFERIIDRIRQGRNEFPSLHVFHFGHRERTAFAELSCRHASREAEVDDLLRDGVFVDLHTVVRQGLRASVESYSLKELEALHGFERKVPLRDAARAMQHFGWWLDSRSATLKPDDLRQTLERYNEEDCYSTRQLRDWLEARRLELQKLTGAAVPRPARDTQAKQSEDKEKHQAERVAAQLREDLPPHDAERSGQLLLADLLQWHRREAKSSFWEYFAAKDVPPNEWLDNRFVLGGLTYIGVVGQVKRSEIHRYEFPPQEHSIREGSGTEAAGTEGTTVNVEELGLDYVLIKRGKSKQQVAHPLGLRPGTPIDTKSQVDRLVEVGMSVLSQGWSSRAEFSAARDLLLRRAPRCGQLSGTALVNPNEDVVDAVKRLVLKLDGSVLPIQGPPGAGKTYCIKEAIIALVKAGKKVGVTANSHAVILGVLKKVHETAVLQATPVKIQHRDDPDKYLDAPLPFTVDKASAQSALANGEINVLGGTTYTWAHADFAASVDVLFVDEAGQMSLANALAVSTAAKSLVLVGDPAQLEQPQKGVHPPDADVSALAHVLGDAQTMPPELGVFLPTTRRLHPVICEFTSDIFYEGKLKPLPELAVQRINGPEPFDGAGLRFIAVSHEGNTNRSEEEVDRVVQIVGQLLSTGASFTYFDAESGKASTRVLQNKDILVIAPYNAQVGALKQRLPQGIDIGTVDKFQGREAPIVIFSMTTSSGEEAPRGLEFLYSLNRLNVATSRAQALVVVVANPNLVRARCRTPRQLQLVNAMCAYLERATTSS